MATKTSKSAGASKNSLQRPVLRPRIKFPSTAIVSLNLKKCFNESFADIIARLEAYRNFQRNQMTKLENFKNNDGPGDGSGCYETVSVTEKVSKVEMKIRKIKKTASLISSKRNKPKIKSLGLIFIRNFSYFSRLGDKASRGVTISLPKTLKWLKRAQLLDNKRITIRDVEVHFINKLKSGYELQILGFISFLKSLCEDRGLPMSLVITKLLGCREIKRRKKRKKIARKKAPAKVKQLKENAPKEKEISIIPQEKEVIKKSITPKTNPVLRGNLIELPSTQRNSLLNKSSKNLLQTSNVQPLKRVLGTVPKNNTKPSKWINPTLKDIPFEENEAHKKSTKSTQHVTKLNSTTVSTNECTRKSLPLKQKKEISKLISLCFGTSVKANSYTIRQQKSVPSTTLNVDMTVRGDTLVNEHNKFQYAYSDTVSDNESGEDKASQLITTWKHYYSLDNKAQGVTIKDNKAQGVTIKDKKMLKRVGLGDKRKQKNVNIKKLINEEIIEVKHFDMIDLESNMTERRVKSEYFISMQNSGNRASSFKTDEALPSDNLNKSEHSGNTFSTAVEQRTSKKVESTSITETREIKCHTAATAKKLDCTDKKRRDLSVYNTNEKQKSRHNSTKIKRQKKVPEKEYIGNLHSLKIQNDKDKPKNKNLRTFTNLPVRRVQKLIREKNRKKEKQISGKVPKQPKGITRSVMKQEYRREIDVRGFFNELGEHSKSQPRKNTGHVKVKAEIRSLELLYAQSNKLSNSKQDKSMLTETKQGSKLYKIRNGVWLTRKEIEDPETEIQREIKRKG